MFYCFSEKLQLIRVKARYRWGGGCSVRRRSFATLTSWASLGVLWLPPPLCPGLLAPFENSSRPVPSPQELGVPAGQSGTGGPPSLPHARCPGGGGAFDQLLTTEAWPALCLGAHKSVKGSPNPLGTGHLTKEMGCKSGDSKPQSELEGSQCPRPVLGYTTDDHSAWGQRRESQEMVEQGFGGSSQREKKGRAMNPSSFHGQGGRGWLGDNQMPMGTEN